MQLEFEFKFKFHKFKVRKYKFTYNVSMLCILIAIINAANTLMLCYNLIFVAAKIHRHRRLEFISFKNIYFYIMQQKNAFLKLQEELQATNVHLSNTEAAFNDVHRKYERLKGFVSVYKSAQNQL